MIFEPVAYFRGSAASRALAARQGIFDSTSSGFLQFVAGKGFEQALRDLDGFERIWVIFQFHHNQHWRPTVKPPIPPLNQDRVGVFASRSPYRPNPIGLSCVRLLGVDRLKVDIAETDLLDGTPVLDIKPYVPGADAFPAARAGWVEHQQAEIWELQESPLAREQILWIQERTGYQMGHLLQVQLSHNPLDSSRKRVSVIDAHTGVFACRTWRVHFRYQVACRILYIEQVCSGYNSSDLHCGTDDPHSDKDAHREFHVHFPAHS